MALPQKKITEIALELGGTAFAMSELRIRGLMRDLETLLRKAADGGEASLAYMMLGVGYARIGLHEKALEMQIKAHKLDPNDPMKVTNLGWALFEVNRPAEALEQWVRSIELLPAEDHHQRAIVFANIAEAFAVLGSPSDATEALQEAVGLLDDKTGINELVIIASQAALLNEDEAALELLARALTQMAGVARDNRSPMDVINATPESVLERLQHRSALNNVIMRARAFPQLADLPRAPRKVCVVDGDAQKVFEDFRDLRERATTIGMGDS